jgi:hypothetical protein
MKRTGCCAWPCTLFLEVIVLVIILLLVGLFVLLVLVFAGRVVVALIVSMLAVMSLVIAIVLVTSMVVAVLAMILSVAQITAASDGKMSRHHLFQLLFLLDLVKDAGRFIVSLTLLEKGCEPKWIHRHCLVCFRKLVLMHLGLCKEDLLTLLLHCGQIHRLTDIDTVEVAEELYSTLHELIHRHKGGLLGCPKQCISWLPIFGNPATASK